MVWIPSLEQELELLLLERSFEDDNGLFVYDSMNTFPKSIGETHQKSSNDLEDYLQGDLTSTLFQRFCFHAVCSRSI